MIEAEIKLPLGAMEPELLCEALCNLGFLPVGQLLESDIYFDNSAGEIRKNDCALRVRRSVNELTGEEQSFITYKGQKLDETSMSRTERETAVQSGEIMTSILMALGFSPVEPQVVKHRQLYYFEKKRIHACVDRVENLGNFLELEILVENESQREEALETMEGVLQNLGLRREDTVRTSYLTMLQRGQK